LRIAQVLQYGSIESEHGQAPVSIVGGLPLGQAFAVEGAIGGVAKLADPAAAVPFELGPVPLPHAQVADGLTVGQLPRIEMTRRPGALPGKPLRAT